MSFEELNLHANLLKGIRELGFTRPTPIQKESIPHILAGKDVIGCAQTGTGKTAAFVLPILDKLMRGTKSQHVRALIIAPTRELALQSMEHLRSLSKHVHLKGAAIFGGVPIDHQKQAIRTGVDIISATPGRLLDHAYQGMLNFGSVEVLVLDEADRMLDMGFLPDVQRILSFLPEKRQNLIFSATMPPEILKLVHTICHNPVTVQIGQRSSVAVGIRHAIYPVSQHLKTELLVHLLRQMEMPSVLVFTRTKHRADRLFRTLEKSGFKVSVLHGDRSQNQRLTALDRFRHGRSQVMVATDIAARGIDINDISHVINYDMPGATEDYVHRIGRTGRAQATGDAFSLVSPEEEDIVRDIQRSMNQQLPRVTLPDFNYKKAKPPKAAGGGHGHGGGGYGGGRHGGGPGGRGRPSRGHGHGPERRSDKPQAPAPTWGRNPKRT